MLGSGLAVVSTERLGAPPLLKDSALRAASFCSPRICLLCLWLCSSRHLSGPAVYLSARALPALPRAALIAWLWWQVKQPVPRQLGCLHWCSSMLDRCAALPLLLKCSSGAQLSGLLCILVYRELVSD